MDFLQVFRVLAYIIPGFIGCRLYQVVYPVKAASDAIVVLWSIIHTFIILVGFGFLSWISGVSRLNFFSRSPDTIGWRSASLLIVSGFVYGGILCGLHWLRQRLNLWPPEPKRVWAKVNEQKEGYWALVRLKENEVIYLGWISDYTFDPDSPDQDFFLRDARCVDENLKVKYLVAGPGVYLNTRDVQAIEYLYGEQ